MGIDQLTILVGKAIVVIGTLCLFANIIIYLVYFSVRKALDDIQREATEEAHQMVREALDKAAKEKDWVRDNSSSLE